MVILILDLGSVIIQMEKENILLSILAWHIKVNGPMGFSKVKEFKNTRMVQVMKDNFKMEWSMEKENYLILMGHFIKVNFKIIVYQGVEYVRVNFTIIRANG